MIGRLTGQIAALSEDGALLDVSGVGYLVFCSARTLGDMQVGHVCSLHILTHVREDHIHLYGFADVREKDWFDLLLSVQGVGPKMALAILSSLDPEELVNALLLEDKRPFQSVSGVGPKLATRLVSELKERRPKGGLVISSPQGSQRRTDEGSGLSEGAAAVMRDLISALTNLGYDDASARRAAQSVLAKADDQTDLASLIPMALKELTA